MAILDEELITLLKQLNDLRQQQEDSSSWVYPLASNYKTYRDMKIIRGHLEAEIYSDPAYAETKSYWDKLSDAEALTAFFRFPAERIERSIGTMFLFSLIIN